MAKAVTRRVTLVDRTSVWTTAALKHLRIFAGSDTARRIVLGIFVIQAAILVFVVHIGVPPDEINHIKFIEYYAQHSLSPIFSHQQPTYNLGDKTREVDYLYHYTMSLLYRVLPLSTEAKYIAIRLCSVLFGLLSFVALAKIFKRLGISSAVTTVSLLVLTNLPMVLLMSAAINNDVLVWLGLMIGLLLLLRLWQEPRVLDLACLFALAIIGGLMKRTLLPLGLLFAVLGAISLVRHVHTFREQLHHFDWRLIAIAIVIVVGLGLFTERVGGNLLRYHTITPSCEQVDGTAACAVFWPNVRAQTLAQQAPETPIPPVRFAGRWLYASLDNVVDIQTQFWLHQVQPAVWLTPMLAFFFLSGLALAFCYDHRLRKAGDMTSRWRLGILLIGLYFMAVHLLVNYQSYQDIKFFGIALNGRYIIPSMLPLVGLVCFYWAKTLRNHPRLQIFLTILILSGTVLGSGLLLMLRNPQLYAGT